MTDDRPDQIARFVVAKHHTSGPLKGLTTTETTSVEMRPGAEVPPGPGGGGYIVVACDEVIGECRCGEPATHHDRDLVAVCEDHAPADTGCLCPDPFRCHC